MAKENQQPAPGDPRHQHEGGETARRWTLSNVGRTLLAIAYFVGAAFNLVYTARHPELFEEWVSEPLLPGYRWFFVEVVAQDARFWVPVASAGEVLLGVLLLARGRAVKLGVLLSILFQLLLAPMWIGQTLANLLLAAVQLPLLRRRYTVSIPTLLTRTGGRG
jgi:hypothetical protein